MRYFIVHIHRLVDPGLSPPPSTSTNTFACIGWLHRLRPDRYGQESPAKPVQESFG